MENAILWFARLARPYQILVAVATFVGITAFGTAAATGNPVFLALAMFWLAVAPAAVWLFSSRDSQS